MPSSAAAAIRLPNPVPSDLDLVGRRFGDICVVSYLRTERAGRIWLCECASCGVGLERSTAGLAWGEREGWVQSCLECRRELRAGRALVRRKAGKKRFLDLWEITGSLYSWWGDTDDIWLYREAECTYGWEPCDDHEDLPCRGDTQLDAYLVEVSGHEWECSCCRDLFTTGYGCLLCLEPVCVLCVDARDHGSLGCNSAIRWDGQYTLDAIGKELGVSRERVRQIELRALRKLRHPSRTKYLNMFADFYWRRYSPAPTPIALYTDYEGCLPYDYDRSAKLAEERQREAAEAAAAAKRAAKRAAKKVVAVKKPSAVQKKKPPRQLVSQSYFRSAVEREYKRWIDSPVLALSTWGEIMASPRKIQYHRIYSTVGFLAVTGEWGALNGFLESLPETLMSSSCVAVLLATKPHSKRAVQRSRVWTETWAKLGSSAQASIGDLAATDERAGK